LRVFRPGWKKLGTSFELRLFLAIWTIYALHVVPGGGVNPNRYFDLTHSLVDQHTITIDRYQENTIDKAFKDGHYYSAGLPGPSIVGAPSYLIFKIAYRFVPGSWLNHFSQVQSFKQGTRGGFYQADNTAFFLSTIWITLFSLSLLSAFAAVVFFRIFLRLGLSQGNALIATVAYAFGTPVFFYSTTYFSHVFSASLAIFALYLVLRLTASDGPLGFVVLGFISGSAMLMEYQSLVLIAGLVLYALWIWPSKHLLAFCVGCAIPFGLLLGYNTLAFGGPFHATYEFLASSDRQHLTGGILGFTIPRPTRLFGLSFSLERGLFLYSPILLLAFVGYVRSFRDKRQPAYGLTGLSIFVFFSLWLWIGSFADWHGGSAFGPRYLTLAIPFAVIGLALSLSYVPKLISVPLLALSVINNWLGAQYGFAENILEPWRQFLTSGFTLPALNALTSHSRGDTPITSFVANRMWLITAIYGALVVGCLILMVSSTLRKRTNLVAEDGLIENQI